MPMLQTSNHDTWIYVDIFLVLLLTYIHTQNNLTVSVRFAPSDSHSQKYMISTDDARVESVPHVSMVLLKLNF